MDDFGIKWNNQNTVFIGDFSRSCKIPKIVGGFLADE